MRFDPKLEKGQVLTNGELVELFECGNMGGMRRSHKTNTLLIISDYTKGIYHDKWDKDVLHYTGMGKNGDQSLDFGQNKTLNQSATNGVTVYLFEVFKKKEYTFMGEIELCETPYQADQPGEDGVMRKVWIFPIRVKENGQEERERLAIEVAKEVEVLEENKEIEETEKWALIKSRVGHGTLKKKLLQKETRCKVCGLSDERFLIASHIKPWSVSDGNERLDMNNVLLLCPHHDAVFDKGYIAFEVDGSLVISEELSLETRALLNLQQGKKITLNERSQPYIKWHRENIFKK